jgi:hypothetical protein
MNKEPSTRPENTYLIKSPKYLYIPGIKIMKNQLNRKDLTKYFMLTLSRDHSKTLKMKEFSMAEKKKTKKSKMSNFK